MLKSCLTKDGRAKINPKSWEGVCPLKLINVTQWVIPDSELEKSQLTKA